MYPLDDEDRKRGSNCPILMVSSEHWNLTKHQAPFRKDFKQNTIEKLTQSSLTHHSHHFDYFRHPFVVTMLDSDHLNYCDMMYLSSPLLMTRANYLGKTNPYHFAAAKDHLILRFFHASSYSRRKLSHPSNDPPSDVLETSPLHTNPPLSGLDSPHSVVHPANQSDVKRLVHYCQISPSDSSSQQDPYWTEIESIPNYLINYIHTNLADESSLPHCYDDEYFNQISKSSP